jgi:uncharacterized protein (TIGR02680 family)
MTLTRLPLRPADDPAAGTSEYPLPASEADEQARGRWVPTRAGIVNVWRYYDETFTFHRGRLLLRGPNGTGKSKALEVLLPFLFDASLRPNRLSTFGGSERTMHWNLMGDGASGVTRVGYVWLEFAMTLGEERTWFCCGARLSASAHTTTVHADYFTTRQRIGTPQGLSLVNEAGQPLTRAALSDVLAGHGELYPTAAEYRTTVRETLFPGLSEQRYDALITALLQLRTPKLSERLDPSLLSTLLSRALPPLGQAEIAELAEGFERLDRQRDHLSRLDAEVEAAARLAGSQGRYAQRVLRSAAAALITATTDLDNLTRNARESEEKYRQALTERDTATRRRAELEARAEELEARRDGLTGSEEYRQGRALDDLRQQTAEAGIEARRQRADAEQKRAVAQTDTDHAEAAEHAAGTLAAQVEQAGSDTRRAAHRAGMDAACAELAAAVADGRGHARQLLRGAVRSRQDQIGAVRGALDAYDSAVRDRGTAEGELEEARQQLADATAHRAARLATYHRTVAEQADSLRRWAVRCAELTFDDPAEPAAQAASETEVLRIVEAATHRVQRDITAAETTAAAARQQTGDDRDRLVAEVERLSRAVDLPPDAPATRTADRAAMQGAPLWRLVAFRDDVAPSVQAGVEAALQASGLLDAWVAPHAGIEVPGHDTLVEAELAVPSGGRSLDEVLRPEPDPPVPADRVRRLLAGVAYGETLPAGPSAAVAADGTWRLDAVTGSWAKDEAAYIGASARERARRRRIAELAAQITELDEVLATLDAELRMLRERRRRLDADRSSRPPHRHVDAAKRSLDRAEADVAARDDAVRARATRLADREKAVGAALRRLTNEAAEHGLPADRGALDSLAAAVDNLREVAEVWLDTQVRFVAEQRAAGDARHRADRSAAAAAARAAEADQAESKARRLAARLQETEGSVGTSYREVLAQIEELRREHGDARGECARLDQQLVALATRIGALGNQRTGDAGLRDAATTTRDSAATRFRHLSALGLPVDAGIDLGLEPASGTRATLEAARAVAARWPSLPHDAKNLTDALGRLTEAVYACRQVLSERADLILEPDQDVQVFTAAMDGVRVGAASLLDALTTERDRSRDDITAAERELFDKTLTGDTRRHLAARIRQANLLVDAMNARLERVRTASRVAVRLVWEVDPALPAGTKAARDLLLKDPVRLTEDDREALHRFFRDRIEEAKASDAATNWEEQLAAVLDYTAWHRFTVKLDRANGAGWQPLTKKLHGALSGGEKAVALHLPLFAAVAAHYQAVPQAPRLILLDEVFVGVDSTNRGQVFGLLSSLGLDLVLTSDHEWCTYRELDGIAVHQLITGDDDDAVTTARFVWTGTDLLTDERPASAATP